MRISPDFVEELKFRNRIEDVVSTYVNLKRTGSNYTGLCPFHSEKTPSFFVSPTRSTFHCFGCGAGGDVITFVMQAENLDYLSSLEVLAQRVGMEMPRDEEKHSEFEKRNRIFEMNKAAARFFNSALNSESAVEAREYIKRRGLTPSVVKRFGLGYAPQSFDALRRHLNGMGFRDEELKEAFLSGKSQKNGSYYDYFRGRLMFPIIDNFGNVIAFGGRAVSDEAKPKYLNTSDTPAFKKSRNLFALNFARNSDFDYMIVCEGYMDVIAMHMAGFSNAVATLGTALTSEQARILSKYTKKVVLSYDSDEAGVNAAKRAMPMLADAGLEVKILQISGAKDPDEYIKKYGADKFRAMLDGSKSKLEFLCDTVLKKYNIIVPEEKIKAASELCEAASSVYSDVEREVYIDRISQRLGIDRNNFKNDVERRRRFNKRNEEAEQSRKIISETLGYGDRINRERPLNIKAAKSEEAIIGIMLLFPELADKIKKGSIALSGENFKTEFNRRVFSSILGIEGKADIGMLGAEFSVDEIARIVEMTEKRAELNDNSEKVLMQNIEALKSQEKLPDGDDIAAALEILNRKNKG